MLHTVKTIIYIFIIFDPYNHFLFFMNNLKAVIDNQINKNAGINLLCKWKSHFNFSDEMLRSVHKIKYIDKYLQESLTDYAANKVLDEFYRINQYYQFNDNSKIELKSIYANLINDLANKQTPADQLAEIHFSNLKQWLLKTNLFAAKMYSNSAENIEPTVCFEYTPRLQLDILQIDMSKIVEPVLDIGCGQKGNLVNYFRRKGIEAFGIDRFPSDSLYIQNTDWLEFDYGVNRWGTIISNLGFSNHFVHHHLRKDGNYVYYAKKYMEVIRSLKVNGSFHYAPDLSFIEQFLDTGIYKIKQKPIDNRSYKSTVIKRLL